MSELTKAKYKMRGLTEQEKKVLRTLAKAGIEFNRLPIVHGMDNSDFLDAMRRAQCLVMSRPAAEELNKNPLIIGM